MSLYPYTLGHVILCSNPPQYKYTVRCSCGADADIIDHDSGEAFRRAHVWAGIHQAWEHKIVPNDALKAPETEMDKLRRENARLRALAKEPL